MQNYPQEKKNFWRFFSEKRYLVLFFLAAFCIGLGLSVFFYFAAKSGKLFLNLIALILFLAVLCRSFIKKWRKVEGNIFRKFLYSIPLFLHIINLVVFFLFFIPKLLRLFSPESFESGLEKVLWFALIGFSLFLLLCLIFKFFFKQEGNLDNA